MRNYAFQQATSITQPGSIANHFGQTLWITLDLVEAATRNGRIAEAAAHVTAIRTAGVADLSPRQQFLSAASAAIAAAGTCPDRFELALATPGADRWPFELARVQLIYGERLRRHAAITESRVAPQHGTHHIPATRRSTMGRPRRQRSSRHRKDQAASRPGDSRPTDTARTRDCHPRRQRAQQQGNRGPAVPVTPNRRDPPLPDLPQARSHLPGRTARRPKRPNDP